MVLSVARVSQTRLLAFFAISIISVSPVWAQQAKQTPPSAGQTSFKNTHAIMPEAAPLPTLKPPVPPSPNTLVQSSNQGQVPRGASNMQQQPASSQTGPSGDSAQPQQTPPGGSTSSLELRPKQPSGAATQPQHAVIGKPGEEMPVMDEPQIDSPDVPLIRDEEADAASAKTLEEVYRRNREERGRFTSAGYLLQVLGGLSIILGLIFLTAKYLLPKLKDMLGYRNASAAPSQKLTAQDLEASNKSRTSLMGALLGTGHKPDVKPQVISRTRLSPNKEIHVVQIGNRQLVIGSTAQQMTLLSEMNPDQNFNDGSGAIETKGNEDSKPSEIRAVYEKYLTRSNRPVGGHVTPTLPDREEVVLLDDYEDHFPPTSH